MGILIFLLVWSVVGAGSYIFWHTRSQDLTSRNLGDLVWYAVWGPMSIIICGLLHYKYQAPIVWIKSRRKD